MNSIQNSNARVRFPRTGARGPPVPHLRFSVFIGLRFGTVLGQNLESKVDGENKDIKMFPKSICLSDLYQIVTQMLV